MLINMGVSILTFLLTIVFVCVLLLLIRLSIKQRLFKKFINYFYTLFVFNGIIRILVETYLELTLTSLVNIQFMKFTQAGEAISAILSMIFSVILLI